MARTGIAVFDLDRTLLTGSSATVFGQALTDAGLAGETPAVAGLLARVYETFGENWLMMQPARLASRRATGWNVDAVADAMEHAAVELERQVLPFALQEIEMHQAAGRPVVLATTSPRPFVQPFADRLGIDGLVATDWERDGNEFTGRVDGEFLWGRAKADAVAERADELAGQQVDLRHSYAYSDSYFDAPLLDMVGHPVAVNPDLQLLALAGIRGWPVRSFDRPEGVASVAGLELQDWMRPLMRPELMAPNAQLEFDGIDNIPRSGPAIVVFNHRSYFDPLVMGLLLAKTGRNVRGLGKKEVFDVPLVGRIMKAAGGIRVDRGTGSDEPLDAAVNAVRGGDLLMLAPQGTIPRGPAFFDPVLKGRWGAARLAAATKAPVIPVGLWGTERVWPRSARMPKMSMTDRPRVSATVGEPVALKYKSPDKDTKRIMTAISELLPPESRDEHDPTEEELLATFPPGYRGDPTAEADRRPGTDT
ncbi:MAG: HAD-IB family hydrolase [Ilumatobacteraceae bacterium]|nr:HAD-IB family hydrolase [Ilumatobacteraceae bacterium]